MYYYSVDRNALHNAVAPVSTHNTHYVVMYKNTNNNNNNNNVIINQC